MGVDAQGSRGGLWLGFKDVALFSCVFLCQNFILVKVNQCDFNQIEYQTNKWGGRVGVIDGINCFREWKASHRLLDIPFKGPKYTWCNNRDNGARIYERLDKGYGSQDWYDIFSNTAILHLPIQISDHAPIIIDTNLIMENGRRPYKIETWNFNYIECMSLIQSTWKRMRREWGGQWTNFDMDLSQAMQTSIDTGDHSIFDSVRSNVVEYSKNLASYWRQRAKISWAMDGDTCSKYFFNWVKTRAGRNFIMGIKSNEHGWLFDHKDIEEAFVAHYRHIYKLNVLNVDFDDYMTKHQQFFNVDKIFLSEDDKDSIERPYSKKEGDVLKAVLQVLNTGGVLEEMNKTFIALVPKCPSPERVEQYRPISLCNVIMKIVTKCIANRLKKFMGALVGPFQNAFVPGRSISDNILIAHEMIHKVSSSSVGNNARMALKADMSKAYDWMKWNFIEATLFKMGFPKKVIDLIMKCISTVSMKFL
ncbi:uncharacterized protein LOC141655512 [Silene latifolia]|uniref:uncharacterized protein LOC141655512 n=1 Tax=Silene latifolia TaxID=37657 RepID=UPI003D76CD84